MELRLETDIKNFLRDLAGLSENRKSLFDVFFISEMHVADLNPYDLKQWKDVFKKRKLALEHTEFNLITHLRTVNQIWFNLAVKIAKLSGIKVLELMLPDETIYPGDEDSVPFYDRLHFLYKDDNGLLRNFFRYATSFQKNGLAYEKGYKLSLTEAEQIKSKSTSINSDNKTCWNFLTDKIMPGVWRTDDSNIIEHFKDVAYPIYACVQDYFENLQKKPADFLVSMRRSILDIYTEELFYLEPHVLHAFYALLLPMSGDVDTSQMSMLNILVDCLQAKSLQEILPHMLTLARWVAEQNPAKIVKQPNEALLIIYQTLQVGVYCKREVICEALRKLGGMEREADINEQIDKTMHVFANQNIPEMDKCLFNEMMALNRVYNKKNARVRKYDIPSLPFGLIATHDDAYHRSETNAQIMRINELLFGWGFWQRHGIDCYYQAMWDLREHYTQKGKIYSDLPRGHFVKPDHDEQGYLISLEDSVSNYAATGLYENVNGPKPCVFTKREYLCSIYLSSPKFRNVKYPRLAEYPMPAVKRSLLNMIFELVDTGFHPKGLKDVYTLKYVNDFLDYKDKIIYIRYVDSFMEYRVKELWTVAGEKKIHTGSIPYVDPETKEVFFKLSDTERLWYVLRYTQKANHTRPGFSHEHYNKTCVAFAKLRENFYDGSISPKEMKSLFDTRFKYGNRLVTIGDMWADGFPECMTKTCQAFWVFLCIYFRGEIWLNEEIEQETELLSGEGTNFLAEARKLGKERKLRPHIIEDVPASVTTKSYSSSQLVTEASNLLQSWLFNSHPISETESDANTSISDDPDSSFEYSSSGISSVSSSYKGEFPFLNKSLQQQNSKKDGIAEMDEVNTPTLF